MAARLDEYTVNSPIGAPPPMTAAQREAAVALNLMLTCSIEAPKRPPLAGERWRGLAEASDVVYNEIGRRGLPQLMSSVKRRLAEEDEPSSPEEN
jgi:hypothetical protein